MKDIKNQSNQKEIAESLGVPKMSSLEIAKLTGKRHDNVIVDIEKMLGSLEKDKLKFQLIYKDSMNRDRKAYSLPKRETIVLVSGYNVKMRAAIIDRWISLEEDFSRAIIEHVEALKVENAQLIESNDDTHKKLIVMNSLVAKEKREATKAKLESSELRAESYEEQAKADSFDLIQARVKQAKHATRFTGSKKEVEAKQCEIEEMRGVILHQAEQGHYKEMQINQLESRIKMLEKANEELTKNQKIISMNMLKYIKSNNNRLSGNH